MVSALEEALMLDVEVFVALAGGARATRTRLSPP